MKIEITSRWDNSVLFTADTENLFEALVLAVKSGANLSRADLSDANLSRAYINPVSILFADWGEVSETLTADLMEYDASNHPNRSRFDDWASGGACPYEGINIIRAANFREHRRHWGKGKLRSAYSLMLSLFQEKEIKFEESY